MTGRTAVADRSTLPLSEVARHVVIPDGIEWSLWDDVSALCYELGDEFDAWQDGLGRVALGIRADNSFAATVGGVILSIARQVAKTFIVGRIVFALCVIFPGLNAIWTAHRVSTAHSAFRSVVGLASRPAAAKYVEKILTGDELTIHFRNGSILRYGARAQNFGRGETQVDVEVFDECQILRADTLTDMVPAANQARIPHGALLFFMGTPPRPKDDGEEFTARRTEALEGKPEGVVVVQRGDAVYVECSADRNCGKPGGPDLMDVHQIEKANPSYPKRTPWISILRMRKNLKNDDDWRREALGIWDDGGIRRFISAADWTATETDTPPPDGIRSFGVAFSLDGSRVAVAGAVKHLGGVHVELIAAHSGATTAGMASLADWLTERKAMTAEIHIAGPDAKVLGDALRTRGVPDRIAKVVTTGDYYAACSALVDAIRESVAGGTSLTHPKAGPDDALNASVAVCDRKVRATGAWGWTATTADGDETPTEAVSLALRAAKTTKRRPGQKTRGRVL